MESEKEAKRCLFESEKRIWIDGYGHDQDPKVGITNQWATEEH